MTTSTDNPPRTAQRLTIVTAVIRWNRGASGLCADCGRFIAPDEMPRSLVHAHIARLPEQLVRLSLVAPGTRAESAQVDAWMRDQMQKQTRHTRQSPILSRAICFSCSVRLLNEYLHTDGGALTGALAAITPDQWSALLMTCQAGYGQSLERCVVNGRGKVPALADLLSLAIH